MSHGNYSRYQHSRRNGFGMNLFRNTRDRVIGGVCAGLADHFEIHHNIMRVLFIAGVVFTGPLVLWAYAIAWIVLVPRSLSDTPPAFEYDEHERRYRPKNMFRYRESTSERLRNAKTRLNGLALRVEKLERYVTSNKYDLNRQFADLEK